MSVRERNMHCSCAQCSCGASHRYEALLIAVVMALGWILLYAAGV